jgi:serine/threonine protein kinase
VIDTPVYRIDHIPATGASATVVVAEDYNGRLVALKVLKRALVTNPDAFDRAFDEARLLATMHHPNILRVEGVEHIGGRPVVVMEWVRGVSLDHLLQTDVRFPARIAAEIARQTAMALDAAWHHPGPDGTPMHVVHRDVKPSNILLSADGVVKLADFGVAKAEFGGRQTDSLFFVHGSLSYTPPERLEGAPDGPGVDVYALGMSLFELVTGRQLILSRKPDRHDAALDENLRQLACADLAEADGAALRALVRSMCAYNVDTRPSPAQVVREAGAWLDRTGGNPHLDAWAWERVVPVLRERMTPPREHPAWSDVSFLEEVTRRQVTEEAEITVQRSAQALDQWIGDMLRRPDWPMEVVRIKEATRGRTDWSTTPFLAILSRAHAPWWAPWRPVASPAELAAALDVLRHRTDPAVVSAATALRGHGEAPVSSAAQRLLRRADKSG